MRVSISNTLVPAEAQEYEVVERKCIGHPDTLADGLAEQISNDYSTYCLRKFGAILHHNIDKLAVIGGLVTIGFGRGKILKPAKIILNGRMTSEFSGRKIPVSSLQASSIRKYLSKHFPNLPFEYFELKNFTTNYSHNPTWYKPRDLNDLPELHSPHANDTSVCTSFWPLSPLEKLSLICESYFYKNGKPKLKFIGQDIKFMGVRDKNFVEVVLCIPFLSTETINDNFYRTNLLKIKDDLEKIARDHLGGTYGVNVIVNTADSPHHEKHYMLFTGSCIEAGEEGVVGRGNQSRGMISVSRPSGVEAYAGKNPVYHVGKFYTVMADSLSRAIAEAHGCSCQVTIVSKNGDNLYKPGSVHVQTTRKVSTKAVNALITKHFKFRDWANVIVDKQLLLPYPGRGNDFTLND